MPQVHAGITIPAPDRDLKPEIALAASRRSGWIICGALALHTFLFFLFIFARQFFWLNGTPYFVLGDDAMISMRYAWNWAHGLGIYWNAGGSPEGYTNFLLVVVMAALHKVAAFAGIPINLLSGEVLIFNWILGLACIALLYLLTRELTGSPIAAAGGAVCLAVNAQFLLWGKAGFETTMLVFFAVGAGFLAIRERYWAMSLLLAGAVLTRDDAVLMVAAFSLTQFVGEKRTAVLRFFAVTLVPFLVFILHVVFRLRYYGVPLPNTYYLKATNLPINFRLSEGTRYTFGMLPALIFAAWVLWAVLRRGGLGESQKRFHAAMLAMLLLYFLYVLWVGGDAFTGSRLFASIWFIPCVAVGIYSAGAVSTFRGRRLAALFLVTVALSPWNYETAREYGLQFIDLMKGVGHGIGFSYNDSPGNPMDRQARSLLLLTNENVMNVWDCMEIRRDAQRRGIQHPSMAVYYAGAAPYFCPEFAGVDLLGKSDAVIAREEPHLPGRVGHNKYDYEYSFSHYQPTYLLSEMNDVSLVDDPDYPQGKDWMFNWQHLASDAEFRKHYSHGAIAGTHPVIFVRDSAE